VSSGIRWVAPKSARMGQSVTAETHSAVGPAAALATVPDAAPAPQAVGGPGLMEKLILGGLLVAGATAVVTFAFVGSRRD